MNKEAREPTLLSVANALLRMGDYKLAQHLYAHMSSDPFLCHVAEANLKVLECKGRARSAIASVDVETRPELQKVRQTAFKLLDQSCKKELRGSTVPGLDAADEMPPPLLTIVVPAYNCSNVIESTVQDTIRGLWINAEVLIVNDGSTDDTLETASKLADEHASVRVISKANEGAGIARNAAIPHCKGKYCFFLDADDFVDGRELSHAVTQANKTGVDLMFLPYGIEFAGRKRPKSMYADDRAVFRVCSGSKNHYEKKSQALKLTGFPWNRIILTQLLWGERIRFGSTVVHNDILFHWHSICASKRMGFWHRRVCTHRKFREGTLSSIRDNRRLAVLDAIEEVEDELRGNPFFMAMNEEWRCFVDDVVAWNKGIVNDSVRESLALRLQSKQNDDCATSAPTNDVLPFHPTMGVRKGKVSIITVTRDIVRAGDSDYDTNLRHFQEMVRSVVTQTYGRTHIEHVFIDGASSDGTKELIEEMGRDGLVDEFVSEPDRGVYNAMNKGVQACSGEYVLFLNAHDRISQDAVEMLVRVLEDGEVDYAFGNALVVDGNNLPTGQHVGNINRVYFGMPYCHQATLYRRSVLADVPYPEDFRITVWRHALEIYLAGYRHGFVSEILAYFREGGLSTRSDTKRHYIDELEFIRSYIAKEVLGVPYDWYWQCRKAGVKGKCPDESILRKNHGRGSSAGPIVDFLWNLEALAADDPERLKIVRGPNAMRRGRAL